MSEKGPGLVLLKSLTLLKLQRSLSPRYAINRSTPSSPPFNGFEPAQMKPVFNLSQLDEESEDINELDKCYEL